MNIIPKNNTNLQICQKTIRHNCQIAMVVGYYWLIVIKYLNL